MLFLWESVASTSHVLPGRWVCTFRDGSLEQCMKFYTAQAWYTKQFVLLAVVPDREVPNLLKRLALDRQGVQNSNASDWLKAHDHLFKPFAWVEGKDITAPTPGPRKPPVQVPPEVWQASLPTPKRAWDAVQALCAPFAPKGE